MKISKNKLKALKLFSAKRDMRAFLKGAYFGKDLIASTNGHEVIIFDREPVEGQFEGIIKLTDINRMIAISEKDDFGFLGVTITKTENGYNASTGELKNKTGMYGTPIDGSYPDVRNVISRKEAKGFEPQTVGVNPEYLIHACQAAKLVGGKFHMIVFELMQKDKPITIKCTGVGDSETFKVIIMPMRL